MLIVAVRFVGSVCSPGNDLQLVVRVRVRFGVTVSVMVMVRVSDMKVMKHAILMCKLLIAATTQFI